MKISNTPGIPFSFIWVYCRLLPWQQTIAKITIFLLFSTYLLLFLELASVKFLETPQSCENDFGQYFNLKKWKILLTKCFTIFGVTFLMLRVCFKPVTWYIEMQHVRTFFSVWRHSFFVLRDVHWQRVYLREESLPCFLSAIELSAWPLFISWR